MKTKSNVIVLDPIELIRKVKKRYGNSPIFPKKMEEVKANLHLYQKLHEQIVQVI